jgi:methylated-DNA-[protein]-cysteine S-methyltransferase
MYYTTTYASPVGQILLASDGDSIIGAWIEGQKYHGGTPKDAAVQIGDTLRKDDAVQKDDLPVLLTAKDWLDRYFGGDKPGISELPLAPIGSDFRQEVWAILREIPYGETTTYGDIAKTVAAKTGKSRLSAQAVGNAVGHNPISIIVPCHRVVGANGSLTGYAGGIDKKIKLLEHEGADLSRLFVPTKGTAL